MEHAPTIFWVLMVMVFVWFAMILVLFRKLKTQHPEKFKEMGEPSLFWNNSMKTGWATLKFIVKREHKGLNDGSLSMLSDSMLVFFVLYTVLFFGMFFGVLSNVPISAQP